MWGYQARHEGDIVELAGGSIDDACEDRLDDGVQAMSMADRTATRETGSLPQQVLILGVVDLLGVIVLDAENQWDTVGGRYHNAHNSNLSCANTLQSSSVAF